MYPVELDFFGERSTVDDKIFYLEVNEMAYYYNEPSHTFSEYLLVTGYSSTKCIPAN
jgi:hypothetical protein